jgi:hypothetical protein
MVAAELVEARQHLTLAERELARMGVANNDACDTIHEMREQALATYKTALLTGADDEVVLALQRLAGPLGVAVVV